MSFICFFTLASMSDDLVRVLPATMLQQFEKTLTGLGFPQLKATLVARVFMENSLDGVYSHGVNRFPKFVQYVRNGLINIQGEPERVHQSGSLEQWEGNGGPGILNALRCAERAMEIAGEYGIGCVALAHTNHWMRGGTYGWKVAKSGYVYIGWTNTIATMPPWGATDAKLGNNPLVIAVPFQNEAIVLDMAMSQFSFGALQHKKMRNERLTVPGGYNKEGNLSDDAAEILDTQRVLPVGFWKGAGLSLLLDILATVLSAGHSVKAISDQKEEYNLSQVFIAISLDGLKNYDYIDSMVGEIIADYHHATTLAGTGPVLYPGERVLKTRSENRNLGIPVIKAVWEEIISMV
jgi:3-dehydro-L-gulonate 2-dehydrogenase